MQSQETVLWVAVTTAAPDAYGDAEPTDATPVSLSALVALRSSVEASDGVTPHTSRGYTLYLDDVSVVPGADDWFTVRGDRYEVDGPAFQWGSRGVVVDVKRGSL